MAAAAPPGAGDAASASSSTSPDAPSKAAVKRLQRDLAILRRSPNPQIEVRPSSSSLLEWHFVLHRLPSDTPYCGGCFHGKIIFPPEYPHAPPSLLMLTHSGRLEVNKRLCLSMTDFHPESWNPAWSVETILVGLLSFFVSDQETGYGSISASEAARRSLADASWAANARNADFAELFPDFLDLPRQRLAPSEGEDLSIRLGDLERPLLSRPGLEAAEAAPALPLQAPLPVTGPTQAEQAARGADAPASAPALPAFADISATGGAVGGSGEVASEDPPPSFAGAAAQAVDRGEPAQRPQGVPVVYDLTPGASEAASSAEAGRGSLARGRSGASEEEQECWICGEDGSVERLIHPCACRGSMSGVHVSCVEQWVAHHRRSATDAALPRCSVCRQAYSGYERRPGLPQFLRHVICSGTQLVVRTLVLVALLAGFQAAVAGRHDDPPIHMPLVARVLTITAFALLAVHKTVVLTVSFPMNRMPPRRRILQRAFEGDYKKLAVHTAEALASVSILGWWACVGILPVMCLLPFLLLGIIPLTKVLHGLRPSGLCVQTLLLALLKMVITPFVILWFFGRYIYRNPRQVAHPLDAGPHVVVAIAVFSLCCACASNVPVLILCLVHSSLLAVGILELLCVRRLPWRSSTAWWFALQLVALATYFACTLCTFSKGFGAAKHAEAAVMGMLLIWLVLFAGLAVGVNRAHVVGSFRLWQQRHGTFTLRVPDAAAGPAPQAGASRPDLV